MLSRNIIVVQTVFDDLSDIEQSIQSIRLAAHRWGVDFYEMCFFRNPNSPSSIYWDRIWAMENFKKYDKVLILDPDIVINESAPNIFELMEDNDDLCVVKNANEGRISSNFFKAISDNAALLHDSDKLFERKIPDFNLSNYLGNYFNMGVFLYNPKSLSPLIEKLKSLIFSDEEILEYCNYKKNGDWYHSQNLTSAFLTHSNLKIKFLPQEWNWLCPDIHTECNEEYFWGPMKPFIYHFTGTNLAKERLKTYTNWKQNG
jgi:lipopolysaccharide biosynthesis glycosyltransferase